MSENDLPTNPNGPAYEMTETRTGPPLSYVAEKLHNSLWSLHHIYRDASRFISDDATSPALEELNSHREKAWRQTLRDLGESDAETRILKPETMREAVLYGFWEAFRNGLTAFLALHNFLDLANDHELPQRLSTMDSDQFTNWLKDIDQKGWISDPSG